jgi:hypothetical protein
MNVILTLNQILQTGGDNSGGGNTGGGKNPLQGGTVSLAGICHNDNAVLSLRVHAALNWTNLNRWKPWRGVSRWAGKQIFTYETRNKLYREPVEPSPRFYYCLFIYGLFNETFHQLGHATLDCRKMN